MKELLTAAHNKLEGVPFNDVKFAKCACAYWIPDDKVENMISLYEQNADEVSVPMSVTKVMTAMLLIDSGFSLNKKVRIRPEDIIGTEGTSGCLFNVWEESTLRDYLYATLLPSSNQAANVLGHFVGRHLLMKNTGTWPHDLKNQ